MNEKVIVKLIKSGHQYFKSEFTSYEKALDYARKKVEQEGFKAILLRLDDGKVWARTTFYPNESC